MQLAGTAGFYSGVGTVLFNMIANPANGKVYVGNVESRNEVRFEGPGLHASNFGGSTVMGRLAESRITVLSGSHVLPRHLNKHIDYAQRPAPAGVKEHSLATPLDMAISSDGTTLYVAAFGSAKVGVFDTAALEDDSFVPDAASTIPVSGGGPGGLLLHESLNRLYVYTRFDNGIAVIDTQSRVEIDHLSLHNPEPNSVINGRPFLYDAFYTSSNGEASCASCHIFGDLDSLAWDLGNPDDETETNPLIIKLSIAAGNAYKNFHPMKGPMTTQTLRGMSTHGAMHWRGDRNGGPGQAFSEDLAFKAFNPAFVGLIGRTAQLTAAEMQAYTDFILQVTLPPNPIRPLDDSLPGGLAQAHQLYFGNPRRADGIAIGPDGGDNSLGFSCNGCHVLNRAAGFFGTDGKASFENEPQIMKVAHLRNLYQKVGMFGMPNVGFFNGGNNTHQGDQIRGFGYLHDGSTDTLFRFFNATVFNSGFANNQERRNMEALMLAFDTDLFPIVGQQITLSGGNAAVVGPRIDLLLAQAALGRADVVVKGVAGGEARGWYRTSAGVFQGDRISEIPLTDAELRAQANLPGQALTYTAVPPGSGVRIGVDRDEDTYFDRDEIDAQSDPADAGSTPAPGSVPQPPEVYCVGGSVLGSASLRIGANLDPAGDERLFLSGKLVVSGNAPPIVPWQTGIRFGIYDKNGALIFDRMVPPGLAPNAQSPGWRVSGKRSGYRDRSGSAGGIRRVIVRQSPSRPELYFFTASGRLGDFQIQPQHLPVRATVVLGNQENANAAQCASIAFRSPPEARPRCQASLTGRQVRCQ
jgi:hypothetical protein